MDLIDLKFVDYLKEDDDENTRFLKFCKLWATNAIACEINNDGDPFYYLPQNRMEKDEIYYEKIPGFTWDNTISFFELLCWFNQHYNEFIKEARELPQLEATFRDKDTTKIVTRKFVLDYVPKNDCLGINPLMVFHEDYDKHKSWGNPTRRELVFGVGLSDKTQIVDNNDYAGRDKSWLLNFARYYKCEIDDDIYSVYVDLRNKYYDFLRVYSILKNLNLGTDKIYATYIDSSNPLKKIKNFKLFLLGSTNESSYMCTYKLGSKYPIFCGNNTRPGFSNCGFKPDYVPKMTRIRRDRFDVNIDLSDIEFPKLSEYDKQFVYVPKK